MIKVYAFNAVLEIFEFYLKLEILMLWNWKGYREDWLK